MLCRPREDVEGHHLYDFSPKEERDRYIRLLHGITTARDAFTIDRRYVRPDGGLTWVNESVSVTRDRRGQAHDLFRGCVRHHSWKSSRRSPSRKPVLPAPDSRPREWSEAKTQFAIMFNERFVNA